MLARKRHKVKKYKNKNKKQLKVADKKVETSPNGVTVVDMRIRDIHGLLHGDEVGLQVAVAGVGEVDERGHSKHVVLLALVVGHMQHGRQVGARGAAVLWRAIRKEVVVGGKLQALADGPRVPALVPEAPHLVVGVLLDTHTVLVALVVLLVVLVVLPIILLLPRVARVAVRVADAEPPPTQGMQRRGGLRVIVRLPQRERLVEDVGMHVADADGLRVLLAAAGLGPDACEHRELPGLDLRGRGLKLPHALVALALAALVRTTEHAAC